MKFPGSSALLRRAGNIACIGAALAIAACSSDSTTDPVDAAVDVSVSPSSFSMTVGQSSTLVATVTHDGAGGVSGVTWSSSAPQVVKIDSLGHATALSTGTATITATSRFDGSKKATSTITVTSTTLTLLGTGPVPERYTAEVAQRDGFAYTTSWGNRSGTRGDAVKIWNVSGNTPVLVDSLKLTNTGTTSDVQISPDGSLLVVSTEQLGGGSIAIYNRSNPAAPTLISRYSSPETTRGVHTVKLSVINGKLYGFLQIDPTTQEVIVDMSDPANVKQVSILRIGNPYVHDVYVRDGLLFTALWMDGMSIYDVGNGIKGGTPAAPVLVSNVKTKTGQIHNIWWFQDPRGGADAKRFVFLGEEGTWNGIVGTGANTLGDIHVVDIKDINSPKEVAVYSLADVGAGTHNFYLDEPSGILYAAYYNGGVRAIDVRGDLSSCTSTQRASYTSVSGAPLCDLRLMGREAGNALTTGGYFVWGVTMQGTRLFASDMGKGLLVLDASLLKR